MAHKLPTLAGNWNHLNAPRAFVFQSCSKLAALVCLMNVNAQVWQKVLPLWGCALFKQLLILFSQLANFARRLWAGLVSEWVQVNVSQLSHIISLSLFSFLSAAQRFKVSSDSLKPSPTPLYLCLAPFAAAAAVGHVQHSVNLHNLTRSPHWGDCRPLSSKVFKAFLAFVNSLAPNS